MFNNKATSNISSNKLFKDVDFSTLNLATSSKDLKKFNEGDIINLDGKGKYLYLIIEGEVKIKSRDQRGQSTIINKNKNDFFFGKELLTNSSQNISAVALKKTMLYRISLKQLNSLVTKNQKIKDNLNSPDIPEDEFDNEINDHLKDFSDISDINLASEDNYTDEYFEAEKIKSEIEKDFVSSDEHLDTDFTFEDNEFKLVNDESIEVNILKDFDKNIEEEINKESELDNSENKDETKILEPAAELKEPDTSNETLEEKEIMNTKFLAENIKSSNELIARYLTVLNKKQVSDEVKLILNEISQQNNLAQNFIEVASDFSEEKNNQKTEVVNFNETMNNILEKLAEYCELRNVELFKKLNTDVSVNLDKDNFYQACYQIIKNSCDAASKDGKIYVTSTKNDDEIILEIKDNGSGIPENIKDEIFEPFVTDGKDGAGLGLALAKKIINDNGGKISAESTLGEETTITISLPLK